jgi:hypothetical protein
MSVQTYTARAFGDRKREPTNADATRPLTGSRIPSGSYYSTEQELPDYGAQRPNGLRQTQHSAGGRLRNYEARSGCFWPCGTEQVFVSIETSCVI